MVQLDESNIKEKGLEYVRGLDIFVVWGNHYIPYPDMLKDVKDLFNISIEYFGPSDQGSAKCIFSKKESIEIINEKLQIKIDRFAKENNIKINSWEHLK